MARKESSLAPRTPRITAVPTLTSIAKDVGVPAAQIKNWLVGTLFDTHLSRLFTVAIEPEMQAAEKEGRKMTRCLSEQNVIDMMTDSSTKWPFAETDYKIVTYGLGGSYARQVTSGHG